MERYKKHLAVIVVFAVFFISSYGCTRKETTETEEVQGEQASGTQEKQVTLPKNLTGEEYYNFGIENIKKGNFEVAIAAWEKVLEVDPDNVKVYLMLGKAYYTLGEFDKSGRIYRKALELKPDDPSIYFSLGVVYRMNLQYEDAVKMQKEALSLDPNMASAYNELGLTYCKQKKLDEAITAHKTALELNPDLGDAHNYLGVVYLLKGLNKEAEAEFELYKKHEAGASMAPGHGAPSAH